MIDNLEVGEYTLKLRLPNQEYQSISITVHKGKEWNSDFILKKNSLIESETRINSMIYIDKIEKSNENEISVQITGDITEETRVHLYACQFNPFFPEKLFK